MSAEKTEAGGPGASSESCQWCGARLAPRYMRTWDGKPECRATFTCSARARTREASSGSIRGSEYERGWQDGARAIPSGLSAETTLEELDALLREKRIRARLVVSTSSVTASAVLGLGLGGERIQARGEDLLSALSALFQEVP